MAANNSLLEIIEKVVRIDSHMRFAAIIDLKGNIVEGIMKEGKTSLESQKQEEHFCQQVADRRKMRQEFDKPLGKVTQFVIYAKRKTLFVSMEPELSIARKMKIINSIKRVTVNI